MKVKLLKKLRKRGRKRITIYSVTKTNGVVTGMKIGYSEKEYSGVFDLGDTEEEVLKKAENIYIKKYINDYKPTRINQRQAL